MLGGGDEAGWGWGGAFGPQTRAHRSKEAFPELVCSGLCGKCCKGRYGLSPWESSGLNSGLRFDLRSRKFNFTDLVSSL